MFGSVLPLIDDKRSLESTGISIQLDMCSTGELFFFYGICKNGHQLTVFGSVLLLLDDQRSLLKVLAFQSDLKFVAQACYS